MHRNRRVSLICLFVIISAGVAGQKEISSPYARYGIGNLESQGTFRTLAMGGISSGIRNNLTLNFLTPASYSAIDTTSFIFDFGISGAATGLYDGKQKYFSKDMTFSHILLGFPIMKGMGVAAGVMPFSNGYYYMAEDFNPDQPGDTVAGAVSGYHKGTGGYHKAMIGLAYRPFKYISAGVNGFIVFGDITRINDFTFNEDINYFNTRKQGVNSMRGIACELSLQFMLPMAERRFVNAGLTYAPGFNLKTSNDDLILRYSNIQTSSLALDTLFQDHADTTGRYPYTIRGGISFGKEDKLVIGADFIYTAWTEASLPGSYGTYANTLAFCAGAEFVPDKYSNYSFFDRMEYRIGCHFDESYALYDGNQVKKYGITFGAGIPLRRSRSRVSVYVDLSKRGNFDDDLYRENSISIGASLNLYDYWFLKAKYD